MMSADQPPFTEPPWFVLSSGDAAARQAVEDLGEGVAAMLRMARALLDSQRHLDLTGLDSLVGPLCARALDLPPEQGRALRPLLIGLLADLDALQAAMPPS